MSYSWWHAALKGEKQPVHEGEPHEGRWYMRTKAGPRLPVATWLDGEEMIALVGFATDAKRRNPVDIWTYICQHPVSEAIYRGAYDTGTWPDDPPAAFAPTSDGAERPNEPTGDPAASLKEELAGEKELAEGFLAKPVETQEQADMAGVWAKRLTTLRGRAVDHHKIEKAPILETGREIDTKWFSLRDLADELAGKLKTHVEPFLKAQKRAAEDAQRKAADEAERLRKEADAAASGGDTTEAEALADRAAAAQKTADKKVNPSAGRTGAKVSLRTISVAVITDFDACYAALKTHKDMRDFVQQLADRACRAKVPLAGVEYRNEERAA